VLFTVPSRYWFTIGRLQYLALGRGRPCFPPDVSCPAVLTLIDHPTAQHVAYGALTRSGPPFQDGSAVLRSRRRRVSRPLHRSRTTPGRQRRLARSPPRFGLLPFRSPLLRESSLFLEVLRCFSSPGALHTRMIRVGDGPSRPPGCPIRRSRDYRVPAPPPRVSPRGCVLPRLQAPRHPPSAHLCTWPPRRRSVSAPRARRSPPSPTRATPCPGSTPAMAVASHVRDQDPGLSSLGSSRFSSASPRSRRTSRSHTSRQTRLVRTPVPASPDARPGFRHYSLNPSVVLGTRPAVDSSPGVSSAGVPPDGATPGSVRHFSCQGAPALLQRRTGSRRHERGSRDENAQRTPAGARARRPVAPGARWSRGDSNPGPPPCKGGALPAKLRPRPGPRAAGLPARRGPGRWARLDSNQGPRPYQGRALTT
jgi:hypothetical protein